MLDYEQARKLVLEQVPAARPQLCDLGAAAGLVLAQDIVADADMPAFDRTAMDGFALRSDDARTPGARLRVVFELQAGGPMMPRPIEPGECAAIYTGAAIPPGADAVVMVERTVRDGEFVMIQIAVAKGENIRYQGEDVRRGELLIKPGAVLRPQEIAVCASFGAPRVAVYTKPRVCVISTGDELVPLTEQPGPGAIRDSNGIMLAAQAAAAGADVVRLQTSRDDRDALRAAIEGALQAGEILILSGGVSMGARDYVAPMLSELGFRGGFHKVRIQPGKPIWFGRRDDRLVFGLPGNPVSSFVTFELFVKPALELLLGRPPGPHFSTAGIEGGPAKGGDREKFVPARVHDGKLTFIPWSSSADFVELTRGNALARIPIGAAPAPGLTVEYFYI